MASDFFLEIVTKKGGKIKGESLSAACPNQIEVFKFSLGLTAPTPDDSDGQQPAAIRVDLEEAEFEFETSIASTPLFSTLCTNDVIKQVTLTCRRGGAGQGQEAAYLQWRFHDARLVSFKQGGQGDDINDIIRIAYAGIEIMYKLQKADGTHASSQMAAYDSGANAMTTPTLK